MIAKYVLCLGATPTVQRTMIFHAVKIDAVNRAAEVLQTASGKSINVARVLRTLGENVIATGFLGGETGWFIEQSVQSIGITTDFVKIQPPTRTCVTMVNRADATATELVEETAPVEAAAYGQLLKIIESRLPHAAALVLSGSLTPNAPPDFYADCCRLAREAGVPTILDARGEPLRRALREQPTIVKPNQAELQETVGFAVESPEELRRGIKSLLDQGPRSAVISQGASGAVASDGKSFWRLSSPRVKALNPIGSGDALAAGLAAGIIRQQPFHEACRLGIACGAANALTPTSGEVHLDDVERLLPQVSVSGLDQRT